MKNSYLKYILPPLAILLSLTIMQIFCNGADNSSHILYNTYNSYNFCPENSLDYEFITQEKNISKDSDSDYTAKQQIKNCSNGQCSTPTTKYTKSTKYTINKPNKNIIRRPGIFRRK